METGKATAERLAVCSGSNRCRRIGIRVLRESSRRGEIFFTIWDLVCLFLVPVPTHASAHARHVLAFEVSRFSTGNYSDNNQLYPHSI